MQRGLILIAALAVGALGCSEDGGTQQVSVSFAALVGDQAFVCGDTYDLGSANTPLMLVDFRFYIDNLELRDANGIWNPVQLEETDFQLSTTTLLDFENGCGEVGNDALNDTVVGVVPAGEYDAIRFEMSVPFEMNHENPATAPSPLNITSLQWNWQGGYKFIRLDSGSFSGGGWRMHLGSTGCDGDPVAGGTTECTTPNRVNVMFEGFDPGTNRVVADIAALVAGQDLGNLAPMPPGCMSGPTDPDCTSIFANLGLAFDGNPAPADQTFFRAE